MVGAPCFAVIGDGRVARHFCHYLGLLALPHRQWSRRQNSASTLEQVIEGCTHSLILISDSAIDPFILEHPVLQRTTLVHFSGSLVTRSAAGAHPLMSFTESLYDLDTYRGIPFVIEAGRQPFSELLPGFENPHYGLDPGLKPLYHALCVMSGNFTTLLWDKLFRDFENRLGLPAEAAEPYLERIALNLRSREIAALTGPLARGDLATICSNLRALEDDPYRSVYRGFLDAFGLDPGSEDA